MKRGGEAQRECKCDCESTNAQHGLGLGRMHNNPARGTAHDRDTARLITSCLRFRVASRESSESGNLDFYTPRSSGSGGRKKSSSGRDKLLYSANVNLYNVARKLRSSSCVVTSSIVLRPDAREASSLACRSMMKRRGASRGHHELRMRMLGEGGRGGRGGKAHCEVSMARALLALSMRNANANA